MSSLSSSLKFGRKKVIYLFCGGKLVLAFCTCLAASFSTANSSDETFAQWKEQDTKNLRMNEWDNNTAIPSLGSFPKTTDAMKNWYINLVPLGGNSLMNDCSWSGDSKAFKEMLPFA